MEEKKSYNLVEFNSQMNKVAFHNFKAIDLDLFMAICYRMKRTGEKIVNLSFDEVLDLLPSVKNTIGRNNVKLEKILTAMYEKLLTLSFSFEDEKTYLRFVLFTKFKVDKEKKNIEIKVNEEFSFVLNQISGQYTRVELEYFSKFKSTYSKHLYKILKQFQNENNRNFHWCELQMEDFRNRLDVPQSYKIEDLNKRVLKPIQEDIGAVLQNFVIEKKKRGRKIIAYRFTWTTNNKKMKTYEAVEILSPGSSIEEFWRKHFNEVNYTKKHQTIIENLLKTMTERQVINYLQEQWEYVMNYHEAKNKEAYFSSLILGEKAVLKDYEIQNKVKELSPEQDRIQAEKFMKKIPQFRQTDITEVIKNMEEIKTEEKKEKKEQIIEVTEEEYESKYQEYLNSSNSNDTATQRRIFKNIVGKQYQIKTKKIYTIEDIPEEKLLSKNRKKLVGSALKMRVDKILKEMNQ